MEFIVASPGRLGGCDKKAHLVGAGGGEERQIIQPAPPTSEEFVNKKTGKPAEDSTRVSKGNQVWILNFFQFI